MQCHVVVDADRVGEIEKTPQVETEDPRVVRREVLDLEPIGLRSVSDPVQEELSGRNFLEPDL